jgi:hypothetical protein
LAVDIRFVPLRTSAAAAAATARQQRKKELAEQKRERSEEDGDDIADDTDDADDSNDGPDDDGLNLPPAPRAMTVTVWSSEPGPPPPLDLPPSVPPASALMAAAMAARTEVCRTERVPYSRDNKARAECSGGTLKPGVHYSVRVTDSDDPALVLFCKGPASSGAGDPVPCPDGKPLVVAAAPIARGGYALTAPSALGLVALQVVFDRLAWAGGFYLDPDRPASVRLPVRGAVVSVATAARPGDPWASITTGADGLAWAWLPTGAFARAAGTPEPANVPPGGVTPPAHPATYAANATLGGVALRSTVALGGGEGEGEGEGAAAAADVGGGSNNEVLWFSPAGPGERQPVVVEVPALQPLLCTGDIEVVRGDSGVFPAELEGADGGEEEEKGGQGGGRRLLASPSSPPPSPSPSPSSSQLVYYPPNMYCRWLLVPRKPFVTLDIDYSRLLPGESVAVALAPGVAVILRPGDASGGRYTVSVQLAQPGDGLPVQFRAGNGTRTGGNGSGKGGSGAAQPGGGRVGSFRVRFNSSDSAGNLPVVKAASLGLTAGFNSAAFAGAFRSAQGFGGLSASESGGQGGLAGGSIGGGGSRARATAVLVAMACLSAIAFLLAAVCLFVLCSARRGRSWRGAPVAVRHAWTRELPVGGLAAGVAGAGLAPRPVPDAVRKLLPQKPYVPPGGGKGIVAAAAAVLVVEDDDDDDDEDAAAATKKSAVVGKAASPPPPPPSMSSSSAASSSSTSSSSAATTTTLTATTTQDACAVCLDEFCEAELVTVLPCRHFFHPSCADAWLRRERTCPLCKADVMRALTPAATGALVLRGQARARRAPRAAAAAAAASARGAVTVGEGAAMAARGVPALARDAVGTADAEPDDFMRAAVAATALGEGGGGDVEGGGGGLAASAAATPPPPLTPATPSPPPPLPARRAPLWSRPILLQLSPLRRQVVAQQQQQGDDDDHDSPQPQQPQQQQEQQQQRPPV